MDTAHQVYIVPGKFYRFSAKVVQNLFRAPNAFYGGRRMALVAVKKHH